MGDARHGEDAQAMPKGQLHPKPEQELKARQLTRITHPVGPQSLRAISY